MSEARTLRWATQALAVVGALALARLVLRVPALAPFDPNEGWNAYHAAALLAGGDLYPAAASLYFNNYPPLSFYAVAGLTFLTNDAIAAGRVLSIAGFLWLLATVFVAARALGAARAPAAFACAFSAAVFLLYSHYVGIADPQLFGHAVAATGMAVILRRPRSYPAAAAGAALLAAALFVKPNLLALPLATLVWLAVWERRALVAYVVAGTLTALALLGACTALFGGDFLSHLLSPRIYATSDVVNGSAKWLAKTAPFFLPLAWLALRYRGNAAVSFCVVYAAVSTVCGIYFIGGSGVDQNVFFDAYLALALSAALVLERATATVAALACYLAPLAASFAVQLQPGWLDIVPARGASREFAEAIAFVRAQPGSAACHEQSLCYRAGKPRGVDFVNLVQHVAKGTLDERAFLSKIESRDFGVVQLATEPPDESALAHALGRTYTLARRDQWGVYYVPGIPR